MEAIMTISCTTQERRVETNTLINKYGLLIKREVKIAGY